MDAGTWDLQSPRGKSFSIYDDRVVIRKAIRMGTTESESHRAEDEKIFPFALIHRFTAVESSPKLSIAYRAQEKYFSKSITFKCIEERDNAFNVLTKQLVEQYNLELYRPKKWMKVLSPLAYAMFPAMLIGVAYFARSLESGEGLELSPPKDALDAISHLLTKIIAVLSVKIGSNILFVISDILFLVIAGTAIYLAVTTPVQLPVERRLRHQKLDY
jgi:hypothetical protein